MLPPEFENEFNATASSIKALETRVTPILESVAELLDGILVKRTKESDSAFEKFILGRYRNPLVTCEDIFGATLVLKRVPRSDDRVRLEDLLRERFAITETKSSRTENPFTFKYDDLHYLMQLKDDPILVNKELLTWRFELQVKSYLQFGWAMSTHNLSYKPAIESWRANRLVAQTRALVELADGALEYGEDFLPKTEDRPYAALDDRVASIAIIEKWWKGNALPENKRRFGEFVVEFMKMASITLQSLETLLGTPRAKEIAEKLSINVHQGILILLIENRKDVLIRQLRNQKRFVLITQTMEDMSPICGTIPQDVRISF
jgi:ppGpp synthetase/RelA/SpoT-type nucleotidyltranferase